jgi:L-asparaginase II
MDVHAIVPVAETTRNGAVESIHHGAVVAIAADGSIAWSAGDPDVAVFPRSSLKPLQAQALVDTGLELPSNQLAVACASHSGEPLHIETVRQLLASFGLSESDLANTPALPLAGSAAEAVLRSGGGPTSILQNCSGKHASMLAACVVNGWPTEGYVDKEHPVQRVIDAYIAKAAGGVVHTGVDGCGAPTAMISLRGLANAVRDLAVRGEATYLAMTSRPELVDGSGRHDTDLMRLIPGLVAKGGADGVYVAAHADGRAAALKIADGAERARLPVLLTALRSLGFDVDAVPVPPVLGHDRPVGVVRSLVGAAQV